MSGTASSPRHTLLGFLAIGFWSMSVAFSRSLTEKLGPVTAGAAIFLLAGAAGCAWVLLTPDGLRKLRGVALPYLLGCGALFIAYEVSYYLAVGLAAGRQQVLEVGVINYLWPGLTLAFSVPIQRRKARPALGLGIVVAFAGVVLAMTQSQGFAWGSFGAGLRAQWASYVLAFLAAVTWALYSNFAHKWGSGSEGGAVPVFMLATGIVMAGVLCAFPEHPKWALRAGVELAFMALFPGLLAYAFWDVAMRKGNMILVAAFSHLTPLLSTLVSCLYLGVKPGVGLWIACVLVVGGAFVCERSITHEGIRPAEQAEVA
jgi:drug/metabolite transporter (DMT)-like permease